ncbi:MAG: T9SS type A sorting domain-containing protein [Ignavibacteriae bacterium]|nr:T9SS type A sorting domain-containing protein [Ignavibacteriota bacterium]
MRSISGFLVFVCFLLILITSSVYIYAVSDGVVNRTRKTTLSGCGGCHGNTNSSAVTVSITGPDSVTVSQSAAYTITITDASEVGAGFDISTRRGSLAPISAGVILSGTELTHYSNFSLTSGSISLQFSYTAPSTPGIDSIFATGQANNNDGTPNGDAWNWAPEKRIVVKNSVGIQNISSEVPASFILGQNFPNPFNPTTNIRFSLPESSVTSLTIYDISGKVIDKAFNGKLSAGVYEYQLNGANLSTGIYFYTLTAGSNVITKKMILTK